MAGPTHDADDESIAAPEPEASVSVDTSQTVRRSIRSIEAAAVAGVAYAVLAGIGLALLATFPDLDQSDAQLMAWFDDAGNQTTLILGLNLITLSSIAFLWFVAGDPAAAWQPGGSLLQHRVLGIRTSVRSGLVGSRRSHRHASSSDGSRRRSLSRREFRIQRSRPGHSTHSHRCTANPSGIHTRHIDADNAQQSSADVAGSPGLCDGPDDVRHPAHHRVARGSLPRMGASRERGDSHPPARR